MGQSTQHGNNTSYDNSKNTYQETDSEYYARENYQQGDRAYYDQLNANGNLDRGGDVSNKPNARKHTGFIDYYMKKFDMLARGRLPNKYHVSFYGPYVDQAMLIMSRNALSDKYVTSSKKLFVGTPALFNSFMTWSDMFYDQKSSCLNMYWAASSVSIDSAKANIEEVSMDAVKSMSFPVVTSSQTGSKNSISITIVDDPYMMWFQFFNALFNTQFTPLVLKPTSSFHKIDIRVNEYIEMTTANQRTTDLHIGEMFEFNSCVMESAPKTELKFAGDSAATYTVSFKFPNAFQGTFKDRLRYMRDETSSDKATVISIEDGKAGKQSWDAYGDYNKAFFEQPAAPDRDPNKDKARADTYSAYRISSHEEDSWHPDSLNSIYKKSHARTTVGWNREKWNQATTK